MYEYFLWLGQPSASRYLATLQRRHPSHFVRFSKAGFIVSSTCCAKLFILLPMIYVACSHLLYAFYVLIYIEIFYFFSFFFGSIGLMIYFAFKEFSF